jgi:hypothetical protein
LDLVRSFAVLSVAPCYGFGQSRSSMDTYASGLEKYTSKLPLHSDVPFLVVEGIELVQPLACHTTMMGSEIQVIPIGCRCVHFGTGRS